MAKDKCRTEECCTIIYLSPNCMKKSTCSVNWKTWASSLLQNTSMKIVIDSNGAAEWDHEKSGQNAGVMADSRAGLLPNKYIEIQEGDSLHWPSTQFREH
jgi:hypothetical protein